MSNYSDQNKQNSFSTWLLPVLLLFTFPPLGVVLLVSKLLSNSGRTGSSGTSYYGPQNLNQPFGARTTADPAQARPDPAVFVKQQNKKLSTLDGKGKRLVTLGTVLTIIFGLSSMHSMLDSLYWLLDGDFKWFLEDVFHMLPLLCCLGGSAGCLWAGLRRRKRVRRFRRYLSAIGKQKTVSLSDLASVCGCSVNTIRNDLEDMFNEGLFFTGYLDYGSQMLILDDTGVTHKADPPKEEQPRKAPEKPTENAILLEIRAVNDDIDNEKLSAQIDRIGIITAKILEYQKSRPDKAPQLHSFLSYYLPTTLKILRAYAKLEAQGIPGQNITSAMERIEGMMDKVVEGFEKQLDMLFQSDAMDITTDVEVLERMLAKDGLSSNDGFSLKL